MDGKWYYMIGAGFLSVVLAGYKWLVKYLRAKSSRLAAENDRLRDVQEANFKANEKFHKKKNKPDNVFDFDPSHPWDVVRGSKKSDK